MLGGGEAQAAEVAKTAGGWFAGFLKNKLQVAVAAGLGLLALNLVVTKGFDYTYKQAVMSKLEEGLLPAPTPPAVLPRVALREQVRDMLRPAKPARFYGVIAGPPGSGKTTMLRAVCREVGGGVGYLDVSPAVENFGSDLGEAFNFSLEKQVGLFNIVSQAVLGSKTVELGGDRLGSLRRSCEALHQAAGEFRRERGRPFVLVVDSVDRLRATQEDVLMALLNVEFFNTMRRYAEEWAQDGTIVSVFVASEWRTLRRLVGCHPSQSRAGVPVWVGDVDEAEATQYLQHLGMKAEVAKDCAALVGGSLLLVERAAGLHFAGAGFPEIRARLAELMELDFEQAGVTPAVQGGADDDKKKGAGAGALAALLGAPGGALSAAKWRELVPDLEEQDKLLSSGILRFDGRQVMFRSQLARECAARVVPVAHKAGHK